MPYGVYKHRKWTNKEKEIRSKLFLGRKLSEETKNKIGKANKISIKKKWEDSIYRKMMSDLHKGKKLSEETKRKMSEARSGEKSPNWKGGITPINNKIRGCIEYKLWQDSILARDGYCCKKCFLILEPYKLVAHHIKNFAQYPELRFALDNGITFCRYCHKNFHHIYGKKNNNKEQIEEFIWMN